MRTDLFALSPSELRALLPAPDNVTATADVNRALQRGAILHADIGLRADPLSSAGCAPGSAILALDGSSIGSACERIHWAHARWAMGFWQASGYEIDGRMVRFMRRLSSSGLEELKERSEKVEVKR